MRLLCRARSTLACQVGLLVAVAPFAVAAERRIRFLLARRPPTWLRPRQSDASARIGEHVDHDNHPGTTTTSSARNSSR
jgi:hypothetical protein